MFKRTVLISADARVTADWFGFGSPVIELADGRRIAAFSIEVDWLAAGYKEAERQGIATNNQMVVTLAQAWIQGVVERASGEMSESYFESALRMGGQWASVALVKDLKSKQCPGFLKPDAAANPAPGFRGTT